MIRALSKIGFSGTTLSGVFFLDFTPPQAILLRQNEKTLEATGERLGSVKTLEDVELYQKLHKCSFGFIVTWYGNKKVYQAREFLKEGKNEELRTNLIKGFDNLKRNCKKDTTTILAVYPTTKDFYHFPNPK